MNQAPVLPAKKVVPQDGYIELRNKIRQTLLQGRKRAEALVEREKVRTYWKIGRLIDRHILRHRNRAGYGEQVIERLARDLNSNQTQLYYFLKFARVHPIFPTRGKLEWRHLRSLLEVEESRTRKSLASKAEKEGWSVKTLEAKVSELRQKNKSDTFIPRRGTLRTYRIVTFDKALALDLGFTAYIELNRKQAKGLKDGDIVHATSLSNLKKISFGSPSELYSPGRVVKNSPGSTRATGPGYTYPALLERVIDGDTHWMKIHLGFNIWLREKLRLRGLDTAEVDTKSGRKAKKFVEETLKNFVSFPRPPIKPADPPLFWAEKRGSRKYFVITTTKPDKYDRYLSDIWIGDTNLNQLLLEKGLARLKTTVRPEDWEK